MSGIAGIIAPEGVEPSEKHLLQMSTCLDHRGPHDQGITIQENVGLVHRRLALSPPKAGHQPLSNKTKLNITTDCRLFDNKALREKYKEDYDFHTTLDSEVIFPLYDDYGIEFASHLKGMYAIALYDGHAKELVLARDPAGIKPLYYFSNEGFFYFASEIKCLLSLKIHEMKVDPESLKEVLQYDATSQNHTLFKDIKSVLPGETLVLHHGKIIKRLSQNKHDQEVNCKLNIKKAKKGISEQLIETLDDLIEPEKNTMCFLNRPEDLLLTKALNKRSAEKNHIFSLVIDGEKEDSDAFSKEKNKTEFSFSESDFWKTLPFIAAACDQPCLIPERAFTYFLAKKTKSEGHLLFSALGPEVLLADNPLFIKAKRPKLLGGRLIQRQGSFSPLTDTPVFLGKWQDRLLEEKKIVKEKEAFSKYSRLHKSQILDYDHRFVPLQLATFDCVTSHHGLETRFPFLSERFMTTLMGLPDSLKINHGQTGYILYEMLKNALPDIDILHLTTFKRAKIKEWLRHKASRIGTLVAHQQDIESLFSNDFVRYVFQCKNDRQLKCAWTLLSYALWHQAHIVGVKPVPDTLSFLSAKH